MSDTPRRQVGLKIKWTYEDFKDRAKYKLGQVVYTIDIVNFSVGAIFPHDAILIKENTIYNLSFSTLCAPNPKTCKIIYVTSNAKYADLIFEDLSYSTKEEAIDVLKGIIERSKNYYQERIVEYQKDLDSKYDSWMKYLGEQEESI